MILAAVLIVGCSEAKVLLEMGPKSNGANGLVIYFLVVRGFNWGGGVWNLKVQKFCFENVNFFRADIAHLKQYTMYGLPIATSQRRPANLRSAATQNIQIYNFCSVLLAFVLLNKKSLISSTF